MMKATPAPRSPLSSGPFIADMHDHLGRVRPGDQIGRSDKIEKVLAAHPATLIHDLIPEHGDVGGWAAEGGHAKNCRQPDNFLQIR